MKKLIIVLTFTPIISFSQSNKIDTTETINSILDDIQDFKKYINIDEYIGFIDIRVSDQYRFLLYTFEDRLLKLTNYDKGKNKDK